MRGHQGDDELIEALHLGVEELGASAQLAQRQAGGIADRAARTGPQRCQVGDQGICGVAGEAGAQVVGTGEDQGPGLVDGLDPLAAGAAFGDHQRPDRLDGTVAALRGAAGPARLRGPGGADRIERVGLARPAPVLAVGPVHLDDPDPGSGHVPGQPGTVAAGTLDRPGTHSRSRPARPAAGRSRPG